MLEKGFTVPSLEQPALPPSPAWFPLPAGWIVLVSLLLIALALTLFFRYARWRRNRWRREALEALSQQQNVDGVMALIKQILLVHHPRSQISQSMTPAELLRDVPLDAPLRTAMCEKYCQRDNRLDESQYSRLHKQLAHWLKELPNV